MATAKGLSAQLMSGLIVGQATSAGRRGSSLPPALQAKVVEAQSSATRGRGRGLSGSFLPNVPPLPTI